MSAPCVNGCGRPRDVDPATGVTYLECWPCILGAPAVSPLRARLEARLGMAVADDAEQRADAADLWWEREMMGERPAGTVDATTRDREAA